LIPTARAAALLGAAALVALFLPVPVAGLAMVAVLAATIADAFAGRGAPRVVRRAPHILARGVAGALSITVARRGSNTHVRQAALPDVTIDPNEGDDGIEAVVIARRRGRHVLPPPAVRVRGPLGLGSWVHSAVGEATELLVFPDYVAAQKIALAVRQGRFRDPGRLTRGPLGLGTEFESIRDYVPDDDVRQVNWLATARLGKPMSNQFRIERDRDVVCLVDTGRLMSAPLGDRTRLDATLDAATAVSLVADVVGDRCGVLAFDAGIRRQLTPRRRGGQAVVRAIFDLEPTGQDSDYELAFRNITDAKRTFVLLLTDLLEPSAARPLIESIPIIARRHQVVVAGTIDPDIDEILHRVPAAPIDVFATSVALDVVRAREEAVREIRSVGAEVIEAPPGALAAACVAAYVNAKALARV
jgi:uncharacterized protein (DUF58 family)